ncbi:MAG: hypothetical protein R3B49_05460 [Phycisphaerales bacterium]
MTACGLARIDKDGTIFDHVANEDYLVHLRGGSGDWSYMKFPFIRSIGAGGLAARVGPLKRGWNARFHRYARGGESARKVFMGLTGGPNNITMAYHWGARHDRGGAFDRDDRAVAE